ncbi:MAG: Spx/MgsR family RNA polymerase-binding regulatory protein [Verrucomicrobiota bacterium]|nr:Spx/MgsR family RNA polymerase-binding regulatory protein [Verrucomicrobiota bacterium]
MLTIYTYKNCSTCRKAKKFLQLQSINYEEKPIREVPPTIKELASMLNTYNGQLKRLFNTSSQDYRKAKLKDKLANLSQEEAFGYLQRNGNLIKRPFLIGENTALLGFKESEWASLLDS